MARSQTAKAGGQGALDALSRRFGERLTTVDSERQRHGVDESYHEPMPPDAVLWPESTDEVSAAVEICARTSTPVVAYGAGTSLEGHVAALRGGICIDMTRMNRIIAVRPEDLDVTVEAGVTRRQLNDKLQPQGFFFPDARGDGGDPRSGHNDDPLWLDARQRSRPHRGACGWSGDSHRRARA